MDEVTQESVVDAAKAAAEQCDGPMSRAAFERLSGISQYHIYRLFPDGGWSAVQEMARIAPHPKNMAPLDDDALLAEFDRVANEMGEIPTWTRFADRASISADVIRKRFGGLEGTLKRYREWLMANLPESQLLEQLKVKSKHEIAAPPTPQISSARRPQWSKTAGPEFGSPIDFRGLRHAPINEQGVVYLFGMISYELGFIVEAIHTACPDCEAKRSIGKDRWQRVRIEFEFRSSNFRDHGHDPNDVDLVVCWEHNWADCPIEVLELRSAIDQLDG